MHLTVAIHKESDNLAGPTMFEAGYQWPQVLCALGRIETILEGTDPNLIHIEEQLVKSCEMYFRLHPEQTR